MVLGKLSVVLALPLLLGMGDGVFVCHVMFSWLRWVGMVLGWGCFLGFCDDDG